MKKYIKNHKTNTIEEIQFNYYVYNYIENCIEQYFVNEFEAEEYKKHFKDAEVYKISNINK